MKKIQLKLGKETLSKEQMKKVTGGQYWGYSCGSYYPGDSCGNPTDTCPSGEVLFRCGWHYVEGYGHYAAGVPDCYSSNFYRCAPMDDFCGHRCDVVSNV